MQWEWLEDREKFTAACAHIQDSLFFGKTRSNTVGIASGFRFFDIPAIAVHLRKIPTAKCGPGGVFNQGFKMDLISW